MDRLPIPLIQPGSPPRFPPAQQALTDPNGLLAFGGDLSPQSLLAAYAGGIFPWFGTGEPILWWSPDPRCVFRTDTLRINRSLRRQLAGKRWRLTVDEDFEQVIRRCAEPRADSSGTWIVPEMIDAYLTLHRLGHAHSVETWEGARLVGGIYGVAIGRLFCGESMFSAESGGSKVALVGLAQLLTSLGFPMIDAQVANSHTLGMGAIEIPRQEFLQQVGILREQAGPAGSWKDFTSCLLQP